MINITRNKELFAKQLRVQTEQLEMKINKKLKPIFRSTFSDVAKMIEHGDPLNIVPVIVNRHSALLKNALLQQYKIIGAYNFDQVTKRLQEVKPKKINDYYAKDSVNSFWFYFNNWANGQAASKITMIDATTKDLIRSIIEKGIRDSKSYIQIAGDIRKLSPLISKNRAAMIAITETHTAFNKSTFESIESTNVKMESKEWMNAGDERVRNKRFNHVRSQGETVKMDEYFKNTGESLLYPGDPMGSAGNIIRCFVSSRTLIFTNEGWVKIKDIKIGDLVLTHKNRFRKVLKTNKSNYEGNIIKIFVGEKSVVVTPEHPFLNDKNIWVQAKDLRAHDKIKFMASFCSTCGKEIPYYNKYCSISCSSKETAKKQWKEEKHRKNISEKTSLQLKREYKNGIRDKIKITEKARNKCKEKYGVGGSMGYLIKQKDFREKIKKAVNNKYGSYLNMLKKTAFIALGKVNYKGSKLESVMEKFLIKTGKQFKRQFLIDRRRIDFYIPNEKLFIEVDGYPFHEDKNKERKRDLEILLQYPNHKIAHVEYKTGHPKWEYFDLLKLNHTETFSQLDMEIKDIKKYTLGKMMNGGYKQIYNFSVEEDESYIAKGFISHNCRCVTLYNTEVTTIE
jgi:hypothetical protein